MCPSQISITAEGIEVGAAVTLTRLMKFLKKEIEARPSYETEVFKAVVNQLRQVMCALHVPRSLNGLPQGSCIETGLTVNTSLQVVCGHSDPQRLGPRREHRHRFPHLRPQPRVDGLGGHLHSPQPAGWRTQGPCLAVLPRVQVCNRYMGDELFLLPSMPGKSLSQSFSPAVGKWTSSPKSFCTRS